MEKDCGAGLTCVDFAAEAKDSLPDAGADDGAVLGLVVDDFVFAVLDELS